jgi:hypothetical protein
MALDVWFDSDIRQAIVGLAVMAIDTYISCGEGGHEHVQGVLVMARAMALSFGLDWPAMLGEIRTEGYGWIIDDCTQELIEPG